jgi:hypothetical protein
MYSSSQIALLLLNGAIGGAVWALIAHLIRRYTLHILAGILIAAAVFYLSFAAQSGAGPAWVAAEVAGVLLFGAMGVAGACRMAGFSHRSVCACASILVPSRGSRSPRCCWRAAATSAS